MLIRPKFGSYIPIEAFDNRDYEQEIETVLEEFAASRSYDPAARKRRMEQDKRAEFLAPEEDRGGDQPASFAGPEDARRAQQNKLLNETEAKLSQVGEKAQKLAQERAGEDERNRSLRAAVKELKKEFIEIEDKVSDLRREGESKGQLQATNAAEARKFKELEIRMKREEAKRRAIELGLEYEEDDVLDPAVDKFGINKAWKVFVKRTKNWFHRVDPMYVAARKAQSRFGGGVALYFWFFRWIIFSSLGASIVWIGYYIWAIIDFALGPYALTFVALVPVNLMVASARDATTYAACVTGCTGIILFTCVYKFVHEYKVKHDLEIQDTNQEPVRYAKLMFTAWDWGIRDEGGMHDQFESIAQGLVVLKREDEAFLRIAARTRKDWNRLYTYRVIGLSANFLVILAGWGGIIFSKVYLADILGDSGSGVVGRILILLPAVIPSLINLAMPVLTDMCVDLEAWDDPAFILKMRVGRLYAGKILNALIQVAIVLIFFRGPEAEWGVGRIILRDCSYYSCEDQAASIFFAAFALDVAVSSVAAYFSAAGQYYVFTRVYSWPKMAKAEFLPQRQVIKIFYQQLFVWLCLPHFPFCAVLAPVLWFVQFKVDAHVLFHYNAKPVRPFDAKDTGVYFAVFYSITLFLFLAWFYYVYFFLSTDALDPSCCRLDYLLEIGNSTDAACLASQTTIVNGQEVENGAALCLETAQSANGFTPANAPSTLFASLSMAETLRLSMQTSGEATETLAVLINTPLIAWFAAALSLLWLVYSRMRVTILIEYLEDKVVQLTRKQDALGQQIKVKERKIERIAKEKMT